MGLLKLPECRWADVTRIVASDVVIAAVIAVFYNNCEVAGSPKVVGLRDNAVWVVSIGFKIPKIIALKFPTER